jgi:hypothetical protein
LHEAVSNMHSLSIQYLIHKGADPKVLNTSNETPYELGKQIGHSKSVLDELFSNILINCRAAQTR